MLAAEAQPHSSSATQHGLPREGISHRREVPGGFSTSVAPPALELLSMGKSSW